LISDIDETEYFTVVLSGVSWGFGTFNISRDVWRWWESFAVWVLHLYSNSKPWVSVEVFSSAFKCKLIYISIGYPYFHSMFLPLTYPTTATGTHSMNASHQYTMFGCRHRISL
jgi:hypothetical protein